jgi:ribose 5-phosphate isomerase A
MLTAQQLKTMAAEAALQEVMADFAPNAVLGIGTGSTADLFIDALAAHRTRFRGAVASSERSAQRLRSHGIEVLDLNDIDGLPVYVDGADEVDSGLAMIKGGGGALTREKIVASVARRFVCIADESKLVKVLGAFPLPIEVIPMAREAVARACRALGGKPALREGFITDNGNQILDVRGLTIHDPVGLESQLNQLPGVVTNGLFARRGADLLLLAGQSGVQRMTARAL